MDANSRHNIICDCLDGWIWKHAQEWAKYNRRHYKPDPTQHLEAAILERYIP